MPQIEQQGYMPQIIGFWIGIVIIYIWISRDSRRQKRKKETGKERRKDRKEKKRYKEKWEEKERKRTGIGRELRKTYTGEIIKLLDK